MANIVNTGSVIINTTDGVVAEGKDIIGGYFVTDKIENIPDYTKTAGQLCYCTEESKFYMFNGST
jgi:hypothetical protein